MNVLVVNAGSSSLKYQLFDMENEKVLAKGICERIGDGGIFTHKLPDNPDLNVKLDIEMPNHADATRIVIK